MTRSEPVDGFRLDYERHGTPGTPPVLLHGWPGDRTDVLAVAERLAGSCDVVVPDMRGIGRSDKHRRDPAEHYGAGDREPAGSTELVEPTTQKRIDAVVDRRA